jgi:hypothetical protein
MKITTVGLDLAKSVFTLQGVDERGNIVLRKTVRRIGRVSCASLGTSRASWRQSLSNRTVAVARMMRTTRRRSAKR